MFEHELDHEYEITTYNVSGVEIDHAYADTAEDASCAAETLIDDAVAAGYELRELTVIFRWRGQEVVLGRDVALEVAA